LQKKVKQILSKKKLILLRRLNEIILKLFLTNKDKQKDLLKSRLHQWRAIVKSIECDEKARINFCRTKLKNYLWNKLAKYLEELAKKYSRYLVKNAAKVDILNKGLKHKSFKALIDVFFKKKRFFLDEIREAFLRLLAKHNNKKNPKSSKNINIKKGSLNKIKEEKPIKKGPLKSSFLLHRYPEDEGYGPDIHSQTPFKTSIIWLIF